MYIYITYTYRHYNTVYGCRYIIYRRTICVCVCVWIHTACVGCLIKHGFIIFPLQQQNVVWDFDVRLKWPICAPESGDRRKNMWPFLKIRPKNTQSWGSGNNSPSREKLVVYRRKVFARVYIHVHIISLKGQQLILIMPRVRYCVIIYVGTRIYDCSVHHVCVYYVPTYKNWNEQRANSGRHITIILFVVWVIMSLFKI